MTTYRKSADLILNLAGHEATYAVEIEYQIDPGSPGAHDEPPCDPFAEILSIRRAEPNRGKVASCMIREGFLPAAMVEALERDIMDEHQPDRDVAAIDMQQFERMRAARS